MAAARSMKSIFASKRKGEAAVWPVAPSFLGVRSLSRQLAAGFEV